MKILSPFEQEVLSVLGRLKYRCESSENKNPQEVKEKGFLVFVVNDIGIDILQKREFLDTIMVFLQKRGLDISITADLEDSTPIEDTSERDYIPLGVLKGKSVQTIKAKIAGLIDDLTPKSTAKTEKNSTTPIILPSNTVWGDMEIKFLNKLEIEVSSKTGFLKKYSNADMGFYRGKKEKKPDRQWQFLESLSILQGKNGRGATNADMAHSLFGTSNEKTINNCEKIAKKLSSKLATIFPEAGGDPFESYKEHRCYIPKFKLIPMPTMRGSGNAYVLPRNELREDFDYGHKDVLEEPDEEGFTKL